MNPKSQKMVEVKNSQQYGSFCQNGMTAADRLYRDATDRLEKNFFQSMQDLHEGAKTGRPAISANSKWMSENSMMFNGIMKDFHARQAAFQQR